MVVLADPEEEILFRALNNRFMFDVGNEEPSDEGEFSADWEEENEEGNNEDANMDEER